MRLPVLRRLLFIMFTHPGNQDMQTVVNSRESIAAKTTIASMCFCQNGSCLEMQT